MKRTGIFAGVGILVIGLAVLSSTAIYAQSAGAGDEREDERAASREMDFDEEGAQEEMAGYISGSVTGVNVPNRTLTVMEEDDGDTFTFFVKSAATIEGEDSLSGIAAGDKVTVDYYDLKGRHVAENIAVEEKSGSAGEEQIPVLQKALSD